MQRSQRCRPIARPSLTVVHHPLSVSEPQAFLFGDNKKHNVTIVVPDLNEIKTWAVNQPAIDKFTMDHPEKLINHPGTSLIPSGRRARHDTSAAGASRHYQPSVSPHFLLLCCSCCSQPPVSLLWYSCRHAEAVDGRAGRRVCPHEEL
jgi:hypothetical protein